MEVSSRRRNNEEILVSRKWKDKETTPERTRVWAEPTPPSTKLKNGVPERKVPVVYYLCRNGQLEHPHFMEVPLSSSHGLYLKDVINRLNLLRGKGMAGLYSWSSKRSYKNGFVWHDLAEDDFIYPSHAHDYVLKGSLILEPSVNPTKTLLQTAPSSTSLKPAASCEESEYPVVTRRRNESCDFNEYKVYKTESLSESTRKLAADASTQTNDRRRRRQVVRKDEIQELHEEKGAEPEVNREEIEISPPPSDSSPETLESLMKADGRLILSGGDGNEEGLNRTEENCGKIKASTVLMQLITCGSISFRNCGATAVKEQGLSLIGHYKGRLPRGWGGNQVRTSREILNFSGVKLEDKEYFSGSFIETKKDEVPALKRSNSYNADCRISQLQLSEKETDGTHTRCIPRKSKAMPSKKEVDIIVNGECNSSVSRDRSKIPEVQEVEDTAK